MAFSWVHPVDEELSMKRMKVVGTVIFILFFGSILLGYGQQDQKSDKQGKSERQAEPAQQRGQEQQKQAAQQRAPQRHEKPAPQQRAQQQQERPDPQQHDQQQQQNPNTQQRGQQQQREGRNQQYPQQQHNNQQVARQQSHQPVQQQRTQRQEVAQQSAQRGDWQQRRAHSFETEHRTWRERGGYNGYRIPDAYFSNYYGLGHSFRVYGLPFTEIGGFPRFQYGGYWFSVVDPYPEFWGDDWYQTHDVYVVYSDDGYYLYDSRYPGRPGVAINISL